MKQKITNLDLFKKQRLNEADQLALKGGYTRIRRPGGTTVVAIWDDTEIRHPDALGSEPDLNIRIWRP